MKGKTEVVKVSPKTRRAVMWSALVLVLVVLAATVPGILGYRSLSIQGTSMAPALHGGDALLVKDVGADEVKVGDTITWEHYSGQWIVHRVVRIEPLPQGGFLFQTRGDSNQSSEWRKIDAEEKIVVAVVRVPSLGHVLEFFQTVPGIAVVVVAAIALLVVLTLFFRTPHLIDREGKK